VIFDKGQVELRAEDPESLVAWIYPPIKETSDLDGIFGKAPVAMPSPMSFKVTAEQIQDAGVPREIPIGKNRVAVGPSDGDFNAAAVWRLHLPDDFDPTTGDALLRIRYRGDVARVKIGDKLVMDDFYNGRPLEIGLRRFAAELRNAGALTLQILPLRADAPIFLPDKPEQERLLALESIDVAVRYRVRLAQ